jgi:hypothetical protein
MQSRLFHRSLCSIWCSCDEDGSVPAALCIIIIMLEILSSLSMSFFR